MGKLIPLNQKFSGKEIKIDFSNQAAGMYIVKMKDGEKVMTIKVMKY
jgi:hypothetical protein